MDIYRTEEEQLETIKRWWQKNGRSLIIGVALVVLSVVGWRSWQEDRSNRAEAASAEYQMLLAATEQGGEPGTVMAMGRHLVSEYPASPYAALASLTLARITLLQGDAEAAGAHLRWVMDNAEIPGLKQVARLRLSRVLLTQGQPKAALALLGGVDAGSFQAAFDEVRGDIQLALGNKAEARKAYRDALAGYGSVSEKQNLVSMKLDDLAEAESGNP